MRCLVLAFTSIEDLPRNWQDMAHIDAYGELEKIDHTQLSRHPQIHLHNQFFEIGKAEQSPQSYNYCFIRHPDPWGEPRNWMKAIAAIAECVQGQLNCEFWYPHEIVAFHYLLKELLGENINFIQANQTDSIGDWKNFVAAWQVNQDKLLTNMHTVYQNNKHSILQKLYNNIGQYYNQAISLDNALKLVQ